MTTTTARKTYNGHPSYNAWNVSLWINNDEGLYQQALSCIKGTNTRRQAAAAFLESLGDDETPKTPDGVPYTVTNIMRAMEGM